jgi:hypothetical protein
MERKAQQPTKGRVPRRGVGATGPRRVRGYQVATAGRLMVGLWLSAANPSSVM